jgi:alanine racemase
MAQKGFVPNCHHNWLRGGARLFGSHGAIRTVVVTAMEPIYQLGSKMKNVKTMDEEVVDFC